MRMIQGQRLLSTHLHLLLMILQNILYLRRKCLKSKSLGEQGVNDSTLRTVLTEQTFSADMMCSGAIVFFDSCSHISFASEEIKWMNSEEQRQPQVK